MDWGWSWAGNSSLDPQLVIRYDTTQLPSILSSFTIMWICSALGASGARFYLILLYMGTSRPVLMQQHLVFLFLSLFSQQQELLPPPNFQGNFAGEYEQGQGRPWARVTLRWWCRS